MQADGEIVTAVRSGHREAFATLVARHERAVWVTAWRVLRDGHAAADATQEAFLLAYRRLPELREPARFGIWLLKIARREAVRQARQRSRLAVHSLATIQGEPFSHGGDPAAQITEESAELLAAVARLPAHERLAVSLRYFDGRSVAEAAQALGYPVGTVTKQLSRAIARLKSMLKEVPL